MTDPVGCRGIHVPGHTACLAHLTDPDRATYLAGLTPGAPIDHRGTPFTENLLHTLLEALKDPTTGHPHLGNAQFDEATFTGTAQFSAATFTGTAWFDEATFTSDAWFDEATFTSDARFTEATFTSTAWFDGATFTSDARFGEATFNSTAWFGEATFTSTAWFGEATFTRDAWFGEATFTGDAWFGGATFTGTAWFGGARFTSDAWFEEATFTSDARFEEATFTSDARFHGATFTSDAWFKEATFTSAARFDASRFTGDAQFGEATFTSAATFGEATFTSDAQFGGARFVALSLFGPLVCVRHVDLSGAVFEAPVTIEIAAQEVRCVRTRWESTATLRLRYATVDLTDAVLSFPVAVTTHPAPFTTSIGEVVDERQLAGTDYRVRMTSVRGVDAAHLVLTDTDLSACLFSGAFHLDQLRLEGRCTFAPTPTGLHYWHRVGPYRWTRRRTLAEEHHWRALTVGQPLAPAGQRPSPRDWRPGLHHPDADLATGPEGVAATYRQLRKAFEDGKNEPGAADFYYGEMEMRRHDRDGTPPGERGLLWGYWMLSGYGLRASRALAWLAAAMTTTVVVLMLCGLPTHDPKPQTAGTLTADRRIHLTTTTPDPALTGPWHQRLTPDRAEKATRVVVNSVVFRSSGQNLTTTGTYIEMASRLLEPTLLALAILAIRSRIKR